MRRTMDTLLWSVPQEYYVLYIWIFISLFGFHCSRSFLNLTFAFAYCRVRSKLPGPSHWPRRCIRTAGISQWNPIQSAISWTLLNCIQVGFHCMRTELSYLWPGKWTIPSFRQDPSVEHQFHNVPNLRVENVRISYSCNHYKKVFSNLPPRSTAHMHNRKKMGK